MKLIFWTKIPFVASLRNAFHDALKHWFLSPKKNCLFITEFGKYMFDLQIYFRTAGKELYVNLSNKILSRRYKFLKILNSEQRTFGTGNKSIDVAEIILKLLATESKLSVCKTDLKELLVEGNPVLIIANHPFAPIDGLLLMNLVHRYRHDHFQLVNGNNGLISICPEFNYRIIPVDLSEGALRTSDPIKAKASRSKVIRQCYERLYNSGQCLIMFPSGNISKAMKWGDTIQDSNWLSGVGLLVKLFSDSEKELNILPILIDTHMGSPFRSYNYQLALLENPTSVSAVLMEAFFNPPSTVPLCIGEKLVSTKFKGKTKEEITEDLRHSVYCMAEQLPIATK